MAGELSFLEGQPSGTEEHVETTDTTSTTKAGAQNAGQDGSEPAGGPARGSDGRFTPTAGEAAPAAAPAAAAPAPGEPGHVPLAALLDERDKRKSIESQLATLQEQQRASAAQAAARTNPPPLEEQVQAQRYADNLKFSRRFAEREYGKDVISTVHDWVVAKCDVDPHFNAQMRSSDDPYEAAVQAYNREQVLAEVGAGDLASFKAWKAAQAQAGQAASPVSPPSQPANVATPRSLATAPGNGASGKAAVAVGEGNAYAGLFK